MSGFEKWVITKTLKECKAIAKEIIDRHLDCYIVIMLPLDKNYYMANGIKYPIIPIEKRKWLKALSIDSYPTIVSTWHSPEGGPNGTTHYYELYHNVDDLDKDNYYKKFED